MFYITLLLFGVLVHAKTIHTITENLFVIGLKSLFVPGGRSSTHFAWEYYFNRSLIIQLSSDCWEIFSCHNASFLFTIKRKPRKLLVYFCAYSCHNKSLPLSNEEAIFQRLLLFLYDIIL